MGDPPDPPFAKLCYFRFLIQPDGEIAQGLHCMIPDVEYDPKHCVACAHFHSMRVTEELMKIQKKLLETQLYEVPDAPPPEDEGKDVR